MFWASPILQFRQQTPQEWGARHQERLPQKSKCEIELQILHLTKLLHKYPLVQRQHPKRACPIGSFCCGFCQPMDGNTTDKLLFLKVFLEQTKVSAF
ncbi:MAG: hypothetical protein A2042_08575 [Candidatus Schekmanbacteria bacterium GWA2_38_11]|uniref:Uncharacterized protein n=1 Tax=Candidatus Schekmanbacteria bacterium GWA2_38_11 TaxID=1817876 RepID=A0A1F7RIZ3_9BACT|nr:MAG: hypothetical protein A2042_08575 [Candidatus Schekmanbacteria bacterium GWA2_38_11]